MSEIVSIQTLTRHLTAKLVTARHWHDASFINLPIIYPSGGHVTVRLTHAPQGIKVSDSGFAYREADFHGAGRSFGRTAASIADDFMVSVGKRSVFVDVAPDEVERAIFDVSAASHMIAERIVSKALKEGEASLNDALADRLDALFNQKVRYEDKIVGASSTEWDVTALVEHEGHTTVFQAVSRYATSIYKASTAFHYLANLDSPPTLVSVVANKQELGSNLPLLAQAGRVIEVCQEDQVFLRAAS